MDFFPAEIGKRLVDVSAFLPMPGGVPINVAVAFSRLGAQSAFIGKLGADAWWHHLVDLLADLGVDTREVCFTLQARTGLNFHAQPDVSTAEHLFYRHPGADQLLEPGDLNDELLSHARALHIGSISLIDEPSRSATLRAIELARAGNALIFYDVNYRSDVLPDRAIARNLIRAMLPLVDIVKVNEEEADLLTGTREVEKALSALLASGPQLAVLTLGSKGCAFAAGALTSIKRGVFPALPAAEAVREFMHVSA